MIEAIRNEIATPKLKCTICDREIKIAMMYVKSTSSLIIIICPECAYRIHSVYEANM